MAIRSENKIDLLGVPLTNLSDSDFENFFVEWLNSQKSLQIVFLNFKEFIKERKKLKKGKSYLDKADIIFTTSISVQNAAKKLCGQNCNVRFYPFSFVISLLGILEARGYSAYFLGGTSAQIMKLFSNIRASFPSLKIVGRYKGNFPAVEQSAVLTGIKKASPAFLLVGSKIKNGNLWLKNAKSNFLPGLTLWAPDAFEIMCGAAKKVDESKWNKRRLKASSLLPSHWFNWVSYLNFFSQVSKESKRRRFKK